MRRRGERDPQGAETLGPFADLLGYQYGPANKAVATKKKKQKLSAQRQSAEGAQAPSTSKPAT